LFGVNLKKILWVLPKNTFPVNDGAKKANYSLLSSLSKINIVDVLVALFLLISLKLTPKNQN
jgi:hypothetical protein